MQIIFSLLRFFEYNHLKANPGTWHLLLSSTASADVSKGDLQLPQAQKKPYKESLLTKSLFTPFSLRSYMLLDAVLVLCLFKNWRTLMKAFIESQFNFCPLIWTDHPRRANNKSYSWKSFQVGLFWLHFVFWWITYEGSIFLIHNRNIQSLATEIYKFISDLAPSILTNFSS